MSGRPGPGGYIAAVAVTAILLAGCGSSAAARGSGGPDSRPADAATLPLATAAVSPASSAGDSSWAVVPMGGPGAQQESFWQLFLRPAGAARWRLATPAGVASNGGLVVTGSGARTLVTGFRPSQDLTFSPLAASTDGGARWSQGTLISPGLAHLPGALAAGPGGRLIALTDTGEAEAGTRLGAAWAQLTTRAALALTTPGRACGLTALTAAGWTPAGTPLLAGACRRHGTAAIFALRAGGWQAAGPVLPGSLTGSAVEVVALVTSGSRTTAVLTAGEGRAAAVIAAWSRDGGRHWALSAAVATGGRALRSVSVLTGGSAAVVLAGGRGETIAGPGGRGRLLPPLPAGTATLAAGPAGQLEALAAAGGTLTAWQPGAGGGWQRLQTLHVTIPYGSSS